MKNYFRLIIFSVITLIVLNLSCTTDLPTYFLYEPYTYASVDETGGDWTPVYISSIGLFTIPAPTDITSPEYIAELEEVKAYNSALSADEQEAVDYWGNNSLIRWMEITEEFIAKYNLPPSPDANGEYGVPDAVFPANYPNFPFANPPYACRAYAYLSAATYDALIAAWHYKFLYNRPAPYKVDASITPAFPDNNLPSYPSEDAVIASVAEDVLTFLFPLEVEYIKDKASELRMSRLYAGMNVQSDIDAGDSIGHTIADIFIGRAKTDSMKFAQVLEPEYILMEQAAADLWADQWTCWENLETPQRPIGITPKFGHVVPWWIPSVEEVRPGPPPAMNSAEFETAKQELLDLTKNATTEQRELAYFWGDGFSTYTPAGHWNNIALIDVIDNRLSPLRTARVFAYLNTAMMDAGISCWDTKYFYMYPRPIQTDSEIKTLFGVPNFPSYTSGHSTFSAAASQVLGYFFPANASEFSSMAKDASESRIYSRIHFRFDCETGLEVGEEIGNYAVEAAKVDGAD
ncbi:MAG: phosphatase PAP2 family protein [Chitinophagales bacterium]